MKKREADKMRVRLFDLCKNGNFMFCPQISPGLI